MPQARRGSVVYNLAPARRHSPTFPENRMSEDARAAAVKAALDGYVDPYLGDTLGAAQAVKAVEPHAGGFLARIALGFPVGGPGGGYAPELEAGLRAHLRTAGIDTPL